MRLRGFCQVSAVWGGLTIAARDPGCIGFSSLMGYSSWVCRRYIYLCREEWSSTCKPQISSPTAWGPPKQRMDHEDQTSYRSIHWAHSTVLRPLKFSAWCTTWWECRRWHCVETFDKWALLRGLCLQGAIPWHDLLLFEPNGVEGLGAAKGQVLRMVGYSRSHLDCR